MRGGDFTGRAHDLQSAQPGRRRAAPAVCRQQDSGEHDRSSGGEISGAVRAAAECDAGQRKQLPRFDAESGSRRQRIDADRSGLGTAQPFVRPLHHQRRPRRCWLDRFPRCRPPETLRAQQAAIGHTFAGSSWVNETHFSFTRLRVFDLAPSGLGKNVLADSGDPATRPPIRSQFGLPVADGYGLRHGAGFAKSSADAARQHLVFLVRIFRRARDATPGRPASSSRTSPWRICRACIRAEITFSRAVTRRTRRIPTTTGDSFADFLLGFPAQTQREVGIAQAYLRQNTLRRLLEDDWRITPQHQHHGRDCGTNTSRLSAKTAAIC